MNNQIDFVAIMEGKSDINKIFHSIRIVDVKDNFLCKYDNGVIIKTNIKCFCDKDKKQLCKNCITKIAHKKQKQIVKLQYYQELVGIVLAVPIAYQGEQYVLELEKDITDNMVLNDKHHPDNTNIYDIVNELNNISVMDPFTNLYNKKYITERMIEEINEIKETKESYIVALIDIDNFKWVNDTHGHISGDNVIQDLVHFIHKYTDDHGCWAARYGGDEFLLVFRRQSLERVKRYIDRIEQSFERKQYHGVTGDYQVSISTGIYEFHPDNDDYYSILENADVNMYENKRMKEKL